MHWNHRIIDFSKAQDEPWLAVKEVYYHDDGRLMGYADICTGAEDVLNLRAHFVRLTEAFSHPVLKVSDFTVVNKSIESVVKRVDDATATATDAEIDRHLGDAGLDAATSDFN